MPMGEYSDFQDCLDKNKDKSDPQAFCGYIKNKIETASLFKGSTIMADFGHDQLLEKGGKHFAKIFLLSSASNINKWRVNSGSIKQRIRTFIGRPFISEPNFAHFNAEKLPVEEILKRQEQYRAGTIKDVVVKDDETAFAIVEFENTVFGNKVYNEMKKGTAIYSSPAIAGNFVDINDEKVYTDWIGLHLARVSDPAYGVLHASIKETCDGTGGSCINKLVSTASVFIEDNNSSIIDKNISSQLMSNTDDNKLETALADATSKIALLEKELATAKETQTKGKSTAAETAKPCDETDPMSDCYKAKTASKQYDPQEFERLKAIVAGVELEKQQSFIQKIIEMKATAGIINKENEMSERESLGKLSTEALASKIAEIEPIVNKYVELATKNSPQSFADNSRIVNMPNVGIASTTKLPSKLSDLNGGWF